MKRVFALGAFLPLLLAVACGAEDAESSDEKHTDDADLRSELYGGSTLPDHTLAVTVDDGPNDDGGAEGSGANTRALAEYFASEGVPVTFFFVGKQLTRGTHDVTKAMDGLLRDIKKLPVKGTTLHHLVANHTFTHGPAMELLPAWKQLQEVVDANELLEPYYENDIRFLRTPYGSWNKSIYETLSTKIPNSKQFVGNIFWNVGGQLSPAGCTGAACTAAADWDCWSLENGKPKLTVAQCAAAYFNEVETTAKRRGIVLSHDIKQKSLQMWKILLPRLKANGYKFVRLDQVKELNEALVAAGAKPASAVGGSGNPGTTTPAPGAPAPCKEGGVYCGGEYAVGGMKGKLYGCAAGKLFTMYECVGPCTKQALGVPDKCAQKPGTGP